MKVTGMKYPLYILAFATVWLAGCNQQSSQNETLYIDQLAVAKALGRDEAIATQLNTVVEQLNAQLIEISSSLNNQLALEKEKLGEKPSEEDLDSFRTLSGQATRQLQQTQLVAKRKAQQFQQQLALAFREEITSAAREVAEQRQASAIELIDNSTLWFSPEADITDEVIAVMRSRPLQKPENTEPESASATDKAENSAIEQELRNLEQLVNEVEEQPS